MNHEKKLRNSTVWLLIAVMALSMLSVLSACKATEQDMHVPAEIMRNPETPLVYPGESFVPTAEPMAKPSPEPTPTPYCMSLYSNPYECYIGHLKMMLNREKIGSPDSDPNNIYDFDPYNCDPADALSTSLKFEDGTLTVRSGKVSLGYFWASPWWNVETQTVFTFPNPDIWYDIFPPGGKLAGISNATEELWDGEAADTEIVIPEYDQDANEYYNVIFGGDWMVVHLPSGRDGWSDRYFPGQEDWARKNLSHSAHTWILSTDDNWETWEHWDSLEADALASMASGEMGEARVCDTILGAHISDTGVGYLCYKKWPSWEPLLGAGRPGLPELLVTTDRGKTWKIVTSENAAEFGMGEYFSGMSLSYFEGLHGIATGIDYRLGQVGEEAYVLKRYFIESFDGGRTWRKMYLRYDEKDHGYYLTETK